MAMPPPVSKLDVEEGPLLTRRMPRERSYGRLTALDGSLHGRRNRPRQRDASGYVTEPAFAGTRPPGAAAGPASYPLKPRSRARRLAQPPHLGGACRRMQARSEEHTSELQSHSDLVCRLLLE